MSGVIHWQICLYDFQSTPEPGSDDLTWSRTRTTNFWSPHYNYKVLELNVKISAKYSSNLKQFLKRRSELRNECYTCFTFYQQKFVFWTLIHLSNSSPHLSSNRQQISISLSLSLEDLIYRNKDWHVTVSKVPIFSRYLNFDNSCQSLVVAARHTLTCYIYMLSR